MAREIQGIGFKTADRIAINLGFANDAPPAPRRRAHLRPGDARGGRPHGLPPRANSSGARPNSWRPPPASSRRESTPWSGQAACPHGGRCGATGRARAAARAPPASSSCRQQPGGAQDRGAVARLGADGRGPSADQDRRGGAVDGAEGGFRVRRPAAFRGRQRPRQQVLDPHRRAGDGQDDLPARAGRHPQGQAGARPPGGAHGPGRPAPGRDDGRLRLDDPPPAQVRPRHQQLHRERGSPRSPPTS